MRELAGRVAVVTGGGRGIGASIAKSLAAAGAHVVVSGRIEGTLVSVVEQIRAAGGKASHAVCDVARVDDVARLVEIVHRDAGPATIVVNNAGVARSARFGDTGEDLWREVMSVNLDGSYRVTRAFLGDVMAAGKLGRILFIASTASKIGFHYTSAYCASKHAVLGLCRSIAMEIAPKGPTANCVCPGWVESDMSKEAIDKIVERTGRTEAEARGELERMSPQRRLMTTEEVAAVTLFLATDAASAVNGQAWNVDGGTVMS